MAHFALIENGIVSDVIVVANEDCGGGQFPESEAIGQAFIASIGLSGEWKQTSYNTYRHYEPVFDPEQLVQNENGEMVPKVLEMKYIDSRHWDGGTPFRGQYARIGDVYDSIKDEFITPGANNETV